MRAKSFHDRQKIRLANLRDVRAEMCRAYRAACAKQLDWNDYRAATLGLTRLAMIDQGQMLDTRVAEIEARLAEQPHAPGKSNGHADYARD